MVRFKGSVFIPLLLVLSISGLILIKTIVKNRESIALADYDLAQSHTLSNHVDPPEKWVIYTSSAYKYEIRYPPQWEFVKNDKTSINRLSSFEASLGPKIKLTTSVNTFYEIPKVAVSKNIGQYNFQIWQDSANNMSAVIQADQYYYLVDVYQSGFFKNRAEFLTFFIRILESFKFTT